MVRRRPILVQEIDDANNPKVGIADNENILELVPVKPRYWIPWAELLKKTFNIDGLKCTKCAGQMKLVNYVADPWEVREILTKLGHEIIVVAPPAIGPPMESYRYEPVPDEWGTGYKEA